MVDARLMLDQGYVLQESLIKENRICQRIDSNYRYFQNPLLNS